jgi:hypothetical protein
MKQIGTKISNLTISILIVAVQKNNKKILIVEFDLTNIKGAFDLLKNSGLDWTTFVVYPV